MSLTTHFYDPFFDNSSLFVDFDRLFNVAFDARTGSNPAGKDVQRQIDSGAFLRPRMDLHESKEKNEITATFELPGMKKDDVSIDIHNSRLVVSGKSTLSSELDKEGYAIRERRFGQFERALPLPNGIKPEDIKATMENGVLIIKLPRTSAEQEPKKIIIA